jgi:hypothetical protein
MYKAHKEMHLCPALNPSRSLSLSLAVLCSKEWILLLLMLLLILQMRTPRALYAPSYLPKRSQAGKASVFSLLAYSSYARQKQPTTTFLQKQQGKKRGPTRHRERERETKVELQKLLWGCKKGCIATNQKQKETTVQTNKQTT